MAKQPVVGLGDIIFDPSLQTDEVDHDFFDNPAPVLDASETDPSEARETGSNYLADPGIASGVSSVPSEIPRSETLLRPGFLGYPLEPIKVITDFHQPNLNNSQQVFSTGTLLACLNSPNSPVPNGSHNHDQAHAESAESAIGSTSHGRRAKHQELNPKLKLFDISDSSSEGSGDESDQELSNFLEKYHDLLDADDSDYSDFTEVSPMSSLTVSPLPIVGNEGAEGEESNGLQDSVTENGAHLTAENNHRPSMETMQTANQLGNQVPLVISQLPKQLPLVISTTMTEDASTNSNFKVGDSKDLNQNGDRSPSVSSYTSTPNSSSSLSVSSVSSKRSHLSSSGSSTSGRKQGRNYTFTPDQLKRIERENVILLKKIIDTQRHGHHHNHHHHGYRSTHKSTTLKNLQCSAAIARQRQQRRIDQENLLLMKKLQNAKPSRDIGEAFKTANA